MADDRVVTWPDRLGTLRFWQIQGSPYAQMLREALKPALGVTALSAYLGLRMATALGVGVLTVLGLLVLEVVFGYAVWRFHVMHAELRQAWENNPLAVRQVELLERIASNTGLPERRRVLTAPVSGDGTPGNAMVMRPVP